MSGVPRQGAARAHSARPESRRSSRRALRDECDPATARNSRPFARCMVPIETWPLAVSTRSSRTLKAIPAANDIDLVMCSLFRCTHPFNWKGPDRDLKQGYLCDRWGPIKSLVVRRSPPLQSRCDSNIGLSCRIGMIGGQLSFSIAYFEIVVS